MRELKSIIIKFMEKEITIAKSEGYSSIIFNAGDIGKAINIENRTPSICRVMEYFKRIYPSYEIIHEPKSGLSTTKEIKFYI